MKSENFELFLQKYGQRYSTLLGIDVAGGDDGEIFKWFLAALLFGAPISESSAIRTYRLFAEKNVVTPERLRETGWESLVRILDEGGYTRYDYRTATKLLEAARNLEERHADSLNDLCRSASGPRDLEARLKSLAKGIGDVTASIFLRELRDVWEKADPKPTDRVILAAKRLRIVGDRVSPETALQQMKSFWQGNRVSGKSFVDFEAALLRLGRKYAAKRKKRRRPS